MSALQTDLFAAGEAHSLPPHLDPEKVAAVGVRADVDRDHVGAEKIGRFGTNAEVFVVEAVDHAGAVLWAQQCETMAGANRLRADLLAKLAGNRQQEIFA